MKERGIVACFLALISITALSGLDFDELRPLIDSSAGVRSAELALEIARAQLRQLEYPGDAAFSVQPSVTSVTPEGGPFADQVNLAASFSAALPLGYSASRIEAIDGVEAEWALTHDAAMLPRRRASAGATRFRSTPSATKEPAADRRRGHSASRFRSHCPPEEPPSASSR